MASKKDVEKIINDTAAEIAKNRNMSVEDLKEEMVANGEKYLKSGFKDERLVSDLNNLVLMVIQNTISSTDIGYAFNFEKYFNEGKIEGNVAQYVKVLPVSGVDYDTAISSFIPQKLNNLTENVETFKLVVKNENGTYTDAVKKFSYNFNFNTIEMIQYFINGTLDEFTYEQIMNHFNNPYQLEKTNFFYQEIIKDSNYTKKINGVKTDLFSTLVEEFLPQLELFKQSTSSYNVDSRSKIFQKTNKEDIVIVVNPLLMVKLQSAIMSQTFNSSYINLKDYVGEIVVSDKVLNITTGGNLITQNDSWYVPEDTIYVFDRNNFIKLKEIFTFSGSQEWRQNMSSSQVLYTALIYGVVPWGKTFKFKSAGLTNAIGGK